MKKWAPSRNFTMTPKKARNADRRKNEGYIGRYTGWEPLEAGGRHTQDRSGFRT